MITYYFTTPNSPGQMNEIREIANKNGILFKGQTPESHHINFNQLVIYKDGLVYRGHGWKSQKINDINIIELTPNNFINKLNA